MLLAPTTALAQEPEPADTEAPYGHSVNLDLFALSQVDEGGNPIVTEAFNYLSFRADLRFTVSEFIGLRMNSTLAWIFSDDSPTEFPELVEPVFATSASGRLLTIDAETTVDIEPRGSDWRFSPGGYYHHQRQYYVVGLQFEAAREFAGGDSALAISYKFRLGLDKERWWDFSERGWDFSWTHNLLTAWTQNVSPELVLNLSLQYTRQDGLLLDNYQSVIMYQDGIAHHLADENLPRQRNRGQLNGRLRYTPWRGFALGLDTSAYADDWDIFQLAVEPSIELPFGDVRWRLWYRYADQDGSSYVQQTPTSALRFYTNDADLDDFRIHNPGMVLVLPLQRAGARQVTGRFSLFGFFRDDGISAVAGDMGVSVSF